MSVQADWEIRMTKKKLLLLSFVLTLILTLGACGTESQETAGTGVDFSSLTSTGTMELHYATQYSIEEYGPYKMITIVDDDRFLLVPEEKEVPSHLPEDVTVLKQPLDHTYLVSTSVMDLVQTIGALSDIRLSGTKEDGWYVEEAVSAMQAGDMLYAGKYSAPDYELILNEGCNLAIENTMIYHNPEVKEKLEELRVPVFVERSSYEQHPLGRLEWIRLYGVLFGKEAEADAYYEEQLQKIEPIMEKPDCDCTVAFFYVTTNGAVSVRKSNDYVAQMIGLSGGTYLPDQIPGENENALSTMNMQMEDFYAATKDADILIYNSTIDGELQSMDDLIEKNALFADFKAVQNGNVYSTSNNFFQKSTGIGEFMEDLNGVFSGTDTREDGYLKKLN